MQSAIQRKNDRCPEKTESPPWRVQKNAGPFWSKSQTPCLLLIFTLLFTCGEKKIW